MTTKPTIKLDEEGWVWGYGSIFECTDLHGDKIAPGAFASSVVDFRLKKLVPKMLWQHDPTQPIGLWTDIYEDGKGLFVKGRLLLDIPRAREVYTLIKSGAIDGFSIGFQTKKAIKNPHTKTRHILDLKLFEISVVTFPANPEALISGIKHF